MFKLKTKKFEKTFLERSFLEQIVIYLVLVFAIILLTPVILIIDIISIICFREFVVLNSIGSFFEYEDDSDGDGIMLIIFSAAISMIFSLVMYGIIIDTNRTHFKNPMYIVYDKIGNPIELREYQYNELYSYEYCYYTSNIWLFINDNCWFTESDRYKVVAGRNTVMVYYDSTGKVNYKKLIDMSPDDIINGWSKPIPQKVEKRKINF